MATAPNTSNNPATTPATKVAPKKAVTVKAPTRTTVAKAKPAPKAPVAKAAAAKPAKTPQVAAKAEKPKKTKLVRDSLSIPKEEFEVIAVLKARAAKLGHAAKKTEVIRAGIKAMAALTDQALLKALQAVPSIKTGRPAKHKSK
jgi:hypothetical protein